MEQDDPDSTFGPMKRGDVVKNFVPYAPIKFGSAYYIITPNYGGFKKRTGLNFGGYTESNSTSRIKLRVR